MTFNHVKSLNDSSLLCQVFFFYFPDRKYPWLNICHIFFFQTIQIWWAMYQSQSRSWMSMTMPPILPQTALWLCVKAPRQARLVIASHSFSQCVPITLFRPVSSHLNPWNRFSYLHFSPVLLFSKTIFFHALILPFSSHICMNPHTPMYTNAIDTCINEKHIPFLYDMSDTIKDGFICGSTDFGGS